MIDTCLDLARIASNGRLAPERLAQRRDEKLKNLVAHAYATVPYYRLLMGSRGLRPGDFSRVADLSLLPVTEKAALQACPAEQLRSHRFHDHALRRDRTSGSTGRPFDIWHERGFRLRRNMSFLRSLAAGGYRWPMRLLLVAGAGGRTLATWRNWRYVSAEIEPETLREEIRQWRPSAIYGFATPLRQLARLIARDGGEIPRARRVFTTAEALDKIARELLQQHVGDEVFELYGNTEMGPIAWECPAHDGLHMAEDTTVVELIDPNDGGECRLIATPLDLYAMPLLRYDVGDLAVAMPAIACRCGSPFRRLARIAGRVVDTITRPDGRELSPYCLTEAVEDVPGLLRYQIVQEGIDQFRVRAEIAQGSDGYADAIVAALRPVLGGAVEITVKREDKLDPAPGRKFRVVVNTLRTAPSG